VIKGAEEDDNSRNASQGYVSSCSSGNRSRGALHHPVVDYEFSDDPMVDVKGFHVAKRPKKFAPLGAVDLVVLFRWLIMYLVFEGEIFHRREYLAERIENLSHERYLPDKALAIDIYRKSIHLGHLTGVHLRCNILAWEQEFGTDEPEVLYCVYKL
jgi:hypothetical protein